MFPIMMDEPDAMSVAPSVWHTLENAWRGSPSARPAAQILAQGRRAGRDEPQAPSVLATLALGHLDPSSGQRH